MVSKFMIQPAALFVKISQLFLRQFFFQLLKGGNILSALILEAFPETIWFSYLLKSSISGSYSSPIKANNRRSIFSG